jgi:5-methylcytosine-specific restriction endonuclease McrBC GTP-binding regulatory subunit McrB
MATIEGNIKKNLQEIIALLNEESNEIHYKTIGTNKIYYGSPGTGKSFHVQDKVLRGVEEQYIFRTTFHPDSDYSSFVGTYKPVQVYKTHYFSDISEVKAKFEEMMLSQKRPFHKFIAQYYKELESFDKQSLKNMFSECKITEDTFDAEYSKAKSIAKHLDEVYAYGSEITYKFEPQIFIKAYIKAWENPDEHVYLVIEEINRGNCAQIFGDLFQLLDRKNGMSEYPIKADTALANYLDNTLKNEAKAGIQYERLKIPANLSIIATMNTSDQSLFPMDSAFKRRWEWEYIPIDTQCPESQFTIDIDGEEYPWADFIERVNKEILYLSESEDKQLGNFFIKGNIGKEEFKSKVMFYLWSEVCKDYYKSGSFFKYKIDGKVEEFTFNMLFDKKGNDTNILRGFMETLEVKPIPKPQDDTAPTEN